MFFLGNLHVKLNFNMYLIKNKSQSLAGKTVEKWLWKICQFLYMFVSRAEIVNISFGSKIAKISACNTITHKKLQTLRGHIYFSHLSVICQQISLQISVICSLRGFFFGNG